jgi:hypothetical protein
MYTQFRYNVCVHTITLCTVLQQLDVCFAIPIIAIGEVCARQGQYVCPSRGITGARLGLGLVKTGPYVCPSRNIILWDA